MYSFLLLLVSTTTIFCKQIDFLQQNEYDSNESEEILKEFMDYIDKRDDLFEHDAFTDILENIESWNKAKNKKMVRNIFAATTEEEFAQAYLGLNNMNELRSGFGVQEYVSKGGVPENLDWRDFGYVSSVKDQSELSLCGSCYAFSAVGHIESQHAMKHNTTAVSLSAQQALDCDYLDRGCKGGDPANVFQTLSEQGGSMKDEDYPYVSKQGECDTDKEEIEVKVSGGKRLLLKDEDALKDAVAHLGPLSVAVRFTLQMAAEVTDEIYDGAYCECREINELNHAVLVVGYGTEDNKDYWIIKNSWGDKWGDQGYMRLVRGVGACGIGLVAFTADVE